MGNPLAFTVNDCWRDGWRGRTTIVADEGGFRPARRGDPEPEARLPGTVLPGYRDAHVHLGLIDGSELLAGGIAAVDDFGWSLDLARTWPTAPDLPGVTIAGQLLTAPGGYPTTSGWAPPDAACEVASAADAAAAVDRQLEAGAGFIKVALNADAGPVLDDHAVAAIVERAHARGVAVAAHTQGSGQAGRVFAAGVDLLAHAPWSERLGDDLLAAMAGRSMGWISTLDIHGWGSQDADFVVASDNVRRFAAVGGRIRYGTDLGNGPLPVGVNRCELLALEHAGLGLDALAAAIAPGEPAPRGAHPRTGFSFGRHLSVIPADAAPDRDAEPAAWLSAGRLIDHARLKEHLT